MSPGAICDLPEWSAYEEVKGDSSRSWAAKGDNYILDEVQHKLLMGYATCKLSFMSLAVVLPTKLLRKTSDALGDYHMEFLYVYQK